MRGCVLRTSGRTVLSPNTVAENIQMAHSETLNDVYTDEMKDLWSATIKWPKQSKQ
jgi:hypothetical protein